MDQATRKISRRDLELLLIGLEDGGLNGITRLQKLLFLLQKEEDLKEFGTHFAFTPYKAGPYSPEIYDDLEFLENLGLLESEITAEATAPEAAEIDALSFENLMGEKGQYGSELASDSYSERLFTLTPKGKQHVEEMMANKELDPVVHKIRRIKSRFGRYSLNDLLRYVYTKYPEMATESEIKDKVLGRHR
jgi:uncharacterized protein YwgA